MSPARCFCSSRTTGWCGSLSGSAISPLLPAWGCEPSVLGSGLAIPHLLRYLRPTTGLRGQPGKAGPGRRRRCRGSRLPLTPPHMGMLEKAMAPFAALSRSLVFRTFGFGKAPSAASFGARVEDEGVIDAFFGGAGLGAERGRQLGLAVPVAAGQVDPDGPAVS